jgi:hypothetical protein
MNDYAAALIDAVAEALPGWVDRSVRTRARQARIELDASSTARLDSAGSAARAEVVAELARLLSRDVDAQLNNPMTILRDAVAYPTEVLAELGVPHVVRSEFDERVMPDDVYGLSPATWADLGPSVHEAGIAWGAWKAHTVLSRRRARPGEGSAGELVEM